LNIHYGCKMDDEKWISSMNYDDNWC